MRLAAISDIHGNAWALDAVLEEIGREAPDLVVNLGDHLSGPLDPAGTADRLMERAFPSIRGNHDRELVESEVAAMGRSDREAHARLSPRHLDWLRAMPATLSPLPGVLMVHGGPGGDLVTLLETVTPEGQSEATEAEVRDRLGSAAESLVLCGHTHVQRARRMGDGRLVVNPGSVGLSAYEDDDPYPHRVEAGSPHARWALLTLRDGVWTVEMRRTAYDWDAAADAAAAQGRRRWVRPLREGRV